MQLTKIGLYWYLLNFWAQCCMPISNSRVCWQSYSVFVHEAPDSCCNFTGEQDDQAGEELQDRDII